MLNGLGARELYENLTAGDAHGDVVPAWLDRAAGGYRASLAVAGECDGWWADRELSPLHWELYALSRVSDVLLLGRQPLDDPTAPTVPAVSALEVADHEYLGLFEALGMRPFSGGLFDPFLHEIVEVEPVEDRESPIEVTEVVWPGLMLGDLLFNRAGVRVRAGAEYAQRGVADRSPLYWTFRRRHRPTVDLSQGWGGNSQWRTRLRLDYRTPTGDHLNMDGDRPIDGSTHLSPDHPANLGPDDRLLTPRERRELLRHRCLLRVPEAAAEHAGLVTGDVEFTPFGWRLPAGERAGQSDGKQPTRPRTGGLAGRAAV